MAELEDIILTIDTREQNQVRIKAVEDWFTGHGAMVEHSALKHCDYRLIGEFRGIPVNLGVEAKGWDNFLSDDIAEMEEKLLKATGEYDHVGFFVETQNYTFVPDENNKHSKLNYSIPRLNKNLPAKTLAAFEGFLDTISKHPQIHVRQLRSEAQFPYSLYDLLVYLQKEHTVFSSTRNGTMHKNEYIAWYKHFLATIPSMTTIKRIEKLIVNYPNPFWLCSVSEESLIQVMGKQVGMTVYAVLHDKRFETDEWLNGYHRDGTEKDEPVCTFADPKKHAECKTPDHFKQHSKPSTPKEFIVGFLTQNPAGIKYQDLVKVIEQRYPDIELISELIESFMQEGICYEPRLGLIAINSSHAEGTILSNHNTPPIPSADILPSHHPEYKKVKPKLKGDDTSSHPSSFLKSLPTFQKLDDPQRPPINRNQNSVVKQEGLCELFPPAEINIGLDDKPLDCVVKCRACHQVIIPEQDDDTGFCQDQDCIKIRNEPSLENKLRIFLREPHTVEEIVEKYGCSTGYTYQVCMANVKSGNIKKVTEQDGRVTFQRIT